MSSISVGEALEQKLRTAFAPNHFEVINESSQHSRGVETHFKIIIVSAAFTGLSRVKRQQAIFAVCGDLLEAQDGPIHALTMTIATPEEWSNGGVNVAVSPACRGGVHSKAHST